MQRVRKVSEQWQATAVRDRLSHDCVFVDESRPGQCLSKPGTAPGDDLSAGLAAQGGNLVREVSARDRGLRPRRVLKRLGEDDFANVVHRCGVVVGGGGPERSHLFVSHASHDVRSCATNTVELPLLELLRLRHPTSVPMGCGDVPVDRGSHHQNHTPHLSPP